MICIFLIFTIFKYMDWYTICKLRSLDKKRHRERLSKIENKFTTRSFNDQMNERKLKQQEEIKQTKARELLETIRAMQMVGGDDTQLKQKVSSILKS